MPIAAPMNEAGGTPPEIRPERMLLVMRFFALQVTCESCHNAFLVGGAAANDLDIWRDALLDCPRCGAACPATDSDVVGLTSRRREVDPEPVVEATLQVQRRRSLPWLGWDRRAGLAVE